MTTRIEVVGRVSGRRRWTVEQKLAILRDARDAGAIRDVPLEQLAITLFGGILVYFTFYPSKADRSSLEQAANGFSDTMFDLLLRGVAV